MSSPLDREKRLSEVVLGSANCDVGQGKERKVDMQGWRRRS